ncbi:hypothetical protein [Brevundimonas sp.]|jgi:hypothetical protein|uniref:hypothetical protein n=1 Tax=Brevundimonas sp. TaxID=1871086 RepID=UPI0037BE6F25
MEYQIYLEIDGRSVPSFEPVGATDDEDARAAALRLLLGRKDASEALVYRGRRLLAVLDRSSD